MPVSTRAFYLYKSDVTGHQIAHLGGVRVPLVLIGVSISKSCKCKTEVPSSRSKVTSASLLPLGDFPTETGAVIFFGAVINVHKLLELR